MVDDGDEDEDGLLAALPPYARLHPKHHRRDHRTGARCRGEEESAVDSRWTTGVEKE